MYQKKFKPVFFFLKKIKEYHLRINSSIQKIRSNKDLNNENSMAMAKHEYGLKPNTHYTVSIKHVDNLKIKLQVEKI